MCTTSVDVAAQLKNSRRRPDDAQLRADLRPIPPNSLSGLPGTFHILIQDSFQACSLPINVTTLCQKMSVYGERVLV